MNPRLASVWHCGSACWRVMEKLRGLSGEDSGRPAAEEPRGAGGALRAKSVGRPDAVSAGWRLEIDNGASERANRGVAVGRGNWTFFGSDRAGRMAAVLLSFIATCKWCGVEPFAWFRDVSRHKESSKLGGTALVRKVQVGRLS